MPKIGVSGPWIARYNNINGVVSYTEGLMLARMTEFDAKPDDADDDNNFYSSNSLSETARGESKGGTITESVDHFSQDGSKFLLGVKGNPIEINGEAYEELIFDNSTRPDYLGHGIIIKKRKNGQDYWRAVVYTKVMFSIPGDAATTQGESIEWKAEELTATYMPDDSNTGRWKREATFLTEAKAIAYIEHILNIRNIGELAVTSAAGAAVGNTAISVAPGLIPGNSYKYVIAPDVGMPSFNSLINEGYTDWDGTSDIPATTGYKILIVEVDADSRAQKAGIATVVVNEGD